MRRVIRAIGISAIAAVAVALSYGEAWACSCISPGPPCQAYFQADAVFVGTVLSIETRKAPPDGIERLWARRVVRLSIERAARGVEGTEIEVRTGSGDSDCSYNFKVGQRYFVYAHRAQGDLLTVTSCSRTRPIADASEDLAYLATLSTPATGARVFGRINHWETDHANRRHVDHGGVADVQVLVRGAKGTFSATTDADGRYAINGIPAGDYETELLPPSGFSRRRLSTKFEIADSRACRVQDFSLHYAGRISGTILDADGRPAPDIRVEVAPASRPTEPLLLDGQRTMTDANGLFELADPPPGSYVVGVGLTPEMDASTVRSRTLFPAAFTVGQGTRTEAGVLRLSPPLRRYELRGVAVGSDGAPIAGASVFLVGPTRRQLTMPVRTAADGSFALPVFEGQTYTLRAFVNVSTNPVRQASAEQPFTVSGEPAPIRLVLVVR